LGYIPDLDRISLVSKNSVSTTPSNYHIESISATDLNIEISNVAVGVEIAWIIFGTGSINPMVGGIVAEDAFTVPGGATAYNVPHGLSYTPELTRITIEKDQDYSVGNTIELVSADNTNFTIDVSSTSATGSIYWKIFGSDNATPMTGSEIVSSIDTELGSAAWQAGGGTDQDPTNEIQTIDKAEINNGVVELSLSDDGVADETINLISADANNQIVAGSDGGLFVGTYHFYEDGDATETNIASTVNDRINFSEPLAHTDGSGTFVTVYDPPTFADIQSVATSLFPGSTVDPQTYEITGGGINSNIPLETDFEYRAGYADGAFPLVPTNPEPVENVVDSDYTWTFADGALYTLVFSNQVGNANIGPNAGGFVNFNSTDPNFTTITASLMADYPTITTPNGFSVVTAGGFQVRDIDGQTTSPNTVISNITNTFLTLDTSTLVEAPAGTFTSDNSSTNQNISITIETLQDVSGTTQTFSFDLQQPPDPIQFLPRHRIRNWVEARYLGGQFLDAVDSQGASRVEADITYDGQTLPAQSGTPFSEVNIPPIGFVASNASFTPTAADFDPNVKREFEVYTAGITINLDDVANIGESIGINNLSSGAIYVVGGTANFQDAQMLLTLLMKLTE